jgi:hypothetical protein
VIFTLSPCGVQMGIATTSGVVSGGLASVGFGMGGLPIGVYIISAVYAPGSNFAGSSSPAAATLTVAPKPAVQTITDLTASAKPGKADLVLTCVPGNITYTI